MSNKSVDTKKDNLDQGLLFLSSFAASVLAVVPSLVFKLPLTQFVSLLPLLLIVVLMPLYVGYMRGAIEVDSIGERARGWVYLLFGLGVYTLTIVLTPIYYGSNQLAKYLSYPILGVTILCLAYFTKRFVSWFYSTLRNRPIPLRDKIGIYATVTGIVISALSYQVVLAISLGVPLNNFSLSYDPTTSLFLSVSEGLFFLFPMIIIEVKCHNCLDEATDSFREEKDREGSEPLKALDYLDNMIDSASAVWAAGVGGSRLTKSFIISAILVFGGAYSVGYAPAAGLALVSAGDALSFSSLYVHLSNLWATR